MRITQKMISRNLLTTLTKNRSRAAELQMDIATSRKVRRPSDDPAAMMQIERINRTISKNDQYSRNIGQVSGFVSASMNALDSISEQLAEARQIAIQGASGTSSPDARASLAAVVDQIAESVLELANTEYNNRYIFAGTKTTTQPYSRTGDTVTFDGNTKGIESKIGPDSQIKYNKSGSEIFNPGGGTDVFQALMDLKQGLESDDSARIEAAVGTLDSASRQIINTTAEMGSTQNRLGLTEEMIASKNIGLSERLSEIRDTDVVEALVEHEILENAINTGLKTMSRTIQTTLADFVS
jgi:flagellar hook-associated protein 3 FlgL